MTTGGDPKRYRLRRALELFFTDDGDAYLLRGGSGQEHIVRAPSDADRTLLAALADGTVVAPNDGDDSARLRALVAAGAVVEAPDLSVLDGTDAERFDRQLPYLEDFGDPAEGQRRLRATSVGIIGCGGLGTWALGALACAGVGHFALVDDDAVDLSNLNRQVLYGVADVGADKVGRTAEWLRRFDPRIEVTAHRRRVTGPEDLAPLADCDVWLLTADWPPYELARWVDVASRRHGVPFVLAGQQPPLVKIGPTFLPGEGACLGCLEQAARREFPLYDEIADQRGRRPVAAATLGPASAFVGSLLALEVFHLVVAAAKPATHDRMLVVDLRDLRTTWTTVTRDPGCPACGR